MKTVLFFLSCVVASAATLRLSNYSLYEVSLYEQVSFNPIDDTGRVTLVDPLAPVSQDDYTIGDRALIRIRLRVAATDENYINTWVMVSGDCRIDVSQNGSALITDGPPKITVTLAEAQPPATIELPGVGEVTLPDWALMSIDAAAFFLGFACMSGVVLVRYCLRWFRRGASPGEGRYGD